MSARQLASLPPAPAPGAFSPEEVVAYYEQKTAPILRKYGPGPRVHFHTGLYQGGVDPAWGQEALRARMVEAQEALLEHVAQAWEAPRHLCGEVLDVGCGLGGGALFWAQRYGARVTALTQVPGHIPLLEVLAQQAEVEERVQPLLVDAHEVPGEACYGAAVAIESSCYLERERWFARLARVLRPGARVHLVDCFAGRPEVVSAFDAYWCTRLGTLQEYRTAAHRAGLREVGCTALNALTVDFWSLSLAWTRLELQQVADTPGKTRRHERSLREHTWLQECFREGAIQYLQLVFEKA